MPRNLGAVICQPNVACIMRKTDFSQLPAREGEHNFGRVTDKMTMDFLKEKDATAIARAKVSDLPKYGHKFREVNRSDDMSEIQEVLAGDEAVLIRMQNVTLKDWGIITRADLLKHLCP